MSLSDFLNTQIIIKVSTSKAVLGRLYSIVLHDRHACYFNHVPVCVPVKIKYVYVICTVNINVST